MSFQCLVSGNPRLIMENNRKDIRVEQQHRDSCLPRCIMQAAQDSLIVSHMRTQPGVFIDDTSIPDFRGMHQIFINARNAISELPIEVQRRFKNGRDLISFMGNEENREEAVRLGLIRKKEAPVPSDTDRIIDALKSSPAAKAEGGQGGAR